MNSNYLKLPIFFLLLKGQPPLVLVGNKSDLEDERAVGRQAGHDLAKRWKCTFLETSAKNRLNVNEVNDDKIRILKSNLL